MGKYLADTAVIVEHLRQQEKAYKFLKTYLPSISQVTIAELIEGSKDKNHLRGVNKVVGSLDAIPIKEAYSNLAIDLMQNFFLSHNLRFLDALIAATAIEENLTLITSNTKHFSFIKSLKLEDWNKLKLTT